MLLLIRKLRKKRKLLMMQKMLMMQKLLMMQSMMIHRRLEKVPCLLPEEML